MEEVRRKMEEVRQRHKRLHPYSQSNTESAYSKDPSRYLVAIGGVVAGLAIAGLFWLASTTLADHTSFTASVTTDVIRPGEFRKSTEAITQLNKRVEVLGDTVGMLETKLARVMDITDAVSNGNEKHNPPPAQALLESDEPGPTRDFNKVRGSRDLHGYGQSQAQFPVRCVTEEQANCHTEGGHRGPVST